MAGYRLDRENYKSPLAVEPAPTKLSDRQIRLARRDFWAVEFPHCWFCGDKSDAVHEVTRGSGIRNLAFSRRETWCSTCWRCNCHELTNYAEWPIARQLAWKLVHDPKHFNLAVINEIRGRAQTDIQLAEVAKWLRTA
jgi:hypothetical protein